MIYVTVGTMFLDFPRLIKKMDALADSTGERVVVQIGMGATVPVHCESFAFRPREEVLDLQREARVIVCHAGIGAVMDALQVRRPFLVVPRLKRFGEHMNDHQIEIAEAVERRGWGRTIQDIDDLTAACASPPPPPQTYSPARAPLIAAVRAFVDDTARHVAQRASGRPC